MQFFLHFQLFLCRFLLLGFSSCLLGLVATLLQLAGVQLASITVVTIIALLITLWYIIVTIALSSYYWLLVPEVEGDWGAALHPHLLAHRLGRVQPSSCVRSMP